MDCTTDTGRYPWTLGRNCAGAESTIVYTPEPIILRAEIRLELPLKRKAVYLESQLAKSQ